MRVTRARVCARMYAHDVCLFGARPSGHPLTVNNEHGTYDRCVGDDGYTGCLAQVGISSKRAYICLKEQNRRDDAAKKNSLTLVLESVLSFFLSHHLFRAVEVRDDFGEVGLWQIYISKYV